MSNTEIQQAVDNFLNLLQARSDDYIAETFPNLDGYTFFADKGGRKYIRIVKMDKNGAGHSRSVFCFVERATGNILKAASWKAPAKHARGNILGADPLVGTTQYGAAYL